MFSSLDRMDIELRTNHPGLRLFLQTDHRSRAEIEAEPELSALFALIRILNPKRMAEEDQPLPVVLYCLTDTEPPTFLKEVIETAGGRLLIGMDFDPLSIQPDMDPIDPAVLNEKTQILMKNLAEATSQKYQLPFTLAGLENLENLLTQNETDPSQETEFWSAILELGTFAGEQIRQSKGGEWILSDKGTLPLTLLTEYNNNPAEVNILGKALKRFLNGPEDQVSHMAAILLKGALTT